MANLLYIKASPRGDRSHSSAVGDAFVDAYHQAHPDDQVTTLDVFYDDLPAFDFDAVTAKYKIMHGKDHTSEDRKVWKRIVAVIDEFKAADKYVLAVPMWNFSIPYRLKQYFDVIVQPGQTFTVTDDGNYQGLVTGKPVFIVYARGGAYPPGTDLEALDHQRKYIELILGFIGLTDLRSVVVEPTLMQGPEAAAKNKADAITEAREMAQAF
jgi:FMN-dependent NADH-azoreductase